MQLKVARSPFPEADAIVERLAGEADAVIVDFHAEVTSEKIAMGWHLDGRVAAVLGTHTHVPTADARVLPGGTAFITDVGMTGSRAGVIGVRREQALEAFRTQMPVKFDTADEDVWVNGVVVDVRDDGLANSIEQVLRPARPRRTGSAHGAAVHRQLDPRPLAEHLLPHAGDARGAEAPDPLHGLEIQDVGEQLLAGRRMQPAPAPPGRRSGCGRARRRRGVQRHARRAG